MNKRTSSLQSCSIQFNIVAVMGQTHTTNEFQDDRKPNNPTRQQLKQKVAPMFQQHQGILKIRKVPFRNSVQISQHPPCFLQNIPETLADVLQSRYNTNRYFSESEIQQFVESVLYTLSYLQTKQIAYSNLCTQNIHYDQENSVYKLLPMQLIKQGIYEDALKNKKFRLLSPQLILGLRYKQREIQTDILNKSNVFTLGMILLQMATLQPSIQCYNIRQSEILDDIITDRLQKVIDMYHPQIAKLIQIMIEYDYTKRTNLQELSILVNKTLAHNSVINSSVKRNKSFTRFNNIDESLSIEKPQKDKSYQKQPRNISPSRLKANTVLPINYHQTPKRQPVIYSVQQPQPQYQLPRQRSARRIQYEEEQVKEPCRYQHQDYPKIVPNYTPYPPQTPIYNYRHQQNIQPSPNYSQMSYYHQQYQPQYNHFNNQPYFNQINPTRNYPPSTVMYPESHKVQATYFEPALDHQYEYNPPRRGSSIYVPSSTPSHMPAYQQPIKHNNPYINYRQSLSKQPSFQQQYQDSYSNPNHVHTSSILKNQNYIPPHRDTNYILKQSNIPKYDRKSTDLSDLSDSSIVKIKQQIAKSRQLIMQLQKHDSGSRR